MPESEPSSDQVESERTEARWRSRISKWLPIGINKDEPDNARRFLSRYGNPFASVGVDDSGRAAIEWGVYGVPETFIVDHNDKIAGVIGALGRTEEIDAAPDGKVTKALLKGAAEISRRMGRWAAEQAGA